MCPTKNTYIQHACTSAGIVARLFVVWTKLKVWSSELANMPDIELRVTYRISLKFCRTSKSHHPRNLAASICQLVSNATLEILPHGKGSTVIPYAHAHFMCIQVGLLLKMCAHVRVDLCRCRPRIVATPNGALK